MSKLVLYLRGAEFQEYDIELPPFQHDLVKDEKQNYQINIDLREQYVKAEAEKLKILYTRQLIKCQWDYEIYLYLDSMNEGEFKTENHQL